MSKSKKRQTQKMPENQKQMIYDFQFTAEEVNVIGQALLELPAKTSMALLQKLSAEAQKQEREFMQKNQPVPLREVKKEEEK